MGQNYLEAVAFIAQVLSVNWAKKVVVKGERRIERMRVRLYSGVQKWLRIDILYVGLQHGCVPIQ